MLKKKKKKKPHKSQPIKSHPIKIHEVGLITVDTTEVKQVILELHQVQMDFLVSSINQIRSQTCSSQYLILDSRQVNLHSSFYLGVMSIILRKETGKALKKHLKKSTHVQLKEG